MPKIPGLEVRNGGNSGDNFQKIANSSFRAGITVIIILFLFSASTTAFYTVGEMERGLAFRFNRLTNEQVIPPGLHFKVPFVESVQRFRIDIQSLNVTGIETYTKDNQPVADAHLVVNYRLPTDQMVKVVREFPDYQERLRTLVIDRFKRVLGQQNAVEIASKRNEVTQAVLGSVREEATRLLGLEIVDLQIPDIRLSPQFMVAIEQVAIAKASVGRAEQENARAKIDAIRAATEAKGRADAEIERSKGEAQAITYKAEADAKRIELEGTAKADAAEKLSNAIAKNPAIVDFKRAEQWNGELPLVGGGEGMVLSMDAERLAAMRYQKRLEAAGPANARSGSLANNPALND